MIRILLVEEQKVIREGLKVLLESESDMEIVGSVSNGYAAIAKTEEVTPDIVLISMELSAIDGFDIVKVIREKYTEVKIVIFSDQVNEYHLVQSLEIGVRGYLLKNISVEEIKEALRYIYKGYTHIGNKVFETVVPQLSEALSALSLSQEQLPVEESEIIFGADSEYPQLPQWISIETSSLNGSLTLYQNSPPTTPLLSSSLGFVPTEAPLPFPSTPISEKPDLWRRFWSGAGLVGLGSLAVALGMMSVGYRRSGQIVIENAVINGKTVSLNSPITGKLQGVTYSQGASVSLHQVLAKIEPLPDDKPKKIISQLEEQINLKQQQLNTAQQSLTYLQANLQNISQQPPSAIATGTTSSEQQLQSLKQRIATQETALKEAEALAKTARNDYDRVLELDASGAVSLNQIKAARTQWELASAKATEIKINLEVARKQLDLQENSQPTPPPSPPDRSQEIANVKQQIANQKIAINLFQTELNNLQQKLAEAKLNSNQIQAVEVTAPISGTVYRTSHGVGEIVSSSEPLASIIDCNNLWVEAVVDSKVASKINLEKPVWVKLADRESLVEGKIALIETLGNRQATNQQESIALTSNIPVNNLEQSFSRVIVNVPFPLSELYQREFCSVGLTAQISIGDNKNSALKQLRSQDKQSEGKFLFSQRKNDD